MDTSAFALTFFVVALSMVGLLALAAWVAERQVSRVRVVDRRGRTLAEVDFGSRPGAR